MKILKLMLVGIAVFAGTVSLNAREKSKLTPEQRAEKHTNRMTKELGLTEDQKVRVQELNEGVARKNEAIRNDVNMSPAQKKEAIKGNHDARMGQLKTILTPEQYKKVEEHQAQMKAKKEAKKEEIKKKKASKKTEEELEEL